MAIQSVFDESESTRTYTVTGQVFFSSADKFTSAFLISKRHFQKW